jgi:hypothetical protein
MPQTANSSQLSALLQHPALWRGRNAATPAGFPTGFEALDRVLPGGGWPRRGLVEVLIPSCGLGELRLWAPLVATLTQSETARWCVFVSPPFEPYVPAWRVRGARVDRLLVVRSVQTLWAVEQALLSGACALVFAWLPRMSMRELRRLVLATERGASLGVLFRPLQAAEDHSTALLRMALQRVGSMLRIDLLKCRGGLPLTLELPLP